MKGFLLAVLIFLSSTASAFAVTPDEVLADTALETRARALSLQLRCMVCQNQSIDDSDADLAKDLRVLVRERLTSGDSDEEVLDFVVARYGEFVLLKPRLSTRTVLLWGAPILVLLLGTFVLYRNRKSTNKHASTGLSDDEEKRLDIILKQD